VTKADASRVPIFELHRRGSSDSRVRIPATAGPHQTWISTYVFRRSGSYLVRLIEGGGGTPLEARIEVHRSTRETEREPAVATAPEPAEDATLATPEAMIEEKPEEKPIDPVTAVEPVAPTEPQEDAPAETPPEGTPVEPTPVEQQPREETPTDQTPPAPTPPVTDPGWL
jgi:hypothetical protein